MKVYTLTLNSIEDGKLSYSIVDGIFTDLETAKAAANKAVKAQMEMWKGAKPATLRKVKGYYSAIELKHPELEVYHTYILKENEIA